MSPAWPSSPYDPVFTFRRVSVSFGGSEVLCDIDLDVPAGKHQLKLSIEDTQRRQTEAILDLEVL